MKDDDTHATPRSRAGCYVGSAAIAIFALYVLVYTPSLLDALAASKTKRTMAKMESRGAVIREHSRRHGGFPRSIATTELETDEWGERLRYEGIDCDAKCSQFRLVSAGSDRKFEHPSNSAYQHEAILDRRRPVPDLVYGDQGWVRYPESARHK
jgi:hypothetical protein